MAQAYYPIQHCSDDLNVKERTLKMKTTEQFQRCSQTCFLAILILIVMVLMVLVIELHLQKIRLEVDVKQVNEKIEKIVHKVNIENELERKELAKKIRKINIKLQKFKLKSGPKGSKGDDGERGKQGNPGKRGYKGEKGGTGQPGYCDMVGCGDLLYNSEDEGSGWGEDDIPFTEGWVQKKPIRKINGQGESDIKSRIRLF